MVTAEISQLETECEGWRSALRVQRQALIQDRQKLDTSALLKFSKELLQDLEHFHNQFHIQLINVHDLKQQVKMQQLIIAREQNTEGRLRVETVAEQEMLSQQFGILENIVEQLRADFGNFLEKIRQ